MHKPRRVLFKLSGEMLAGPDACGIAHARLSWLAGEIASARSEGAEVALVNQGEARHVRLPVEQVDEVL